MDLALSGKIAMVSGASTGIGKAIARTLAREGAHLSLCARTAADMGAVAEDIQLELGAQCLATSADLSNSDGVALWIERTFGIFGRVDILINSAGGFPGGDFFAMSEDQWMPAWETKFLGYTRIAQAVMPHMMQRRSGAVVNVVGIAGVQPFANYTMGSAFNAALISMTKSLAFEGGPYGVRVNAVNPGSTRTTRWARLLAQGAERSGKSVQHIEQEEVSGTALRRVAEPHEIADVVAFLASDRASFVTGSTINVDGGAVRGI